MSNLLGLLGFRATPPIGIGGRSKGFTLVELLVVIAIISILATLLLLQLGLARAKARDAKRIADVNQVRSALELYFDDNGSYQATNVMTGLKPTYLINIPKDPIAAGCTEHTPVRFQLFLIVMVMPGIQQLLQEVFRFGQN